jgi:hypothetical protein
MHLHFVLYKIKVIIFSKAEQDQQKKNTHKKKKSLRRQNAASCVESIHTKTNKSKTKEKK